MVKHLIYLAAAVVSFVVGYSLSAQKGARSFSEELQFVQAEKVKNELSTLEDVLARIDKGCISSAKQRLKNKIDQNEMLLAEHLSHFQNGQLASSMMERNPEQFERLKNTEIDWSKEYYVDDCPGL